MIAGAFDYLCPSSLDDALALLAEDPEGTAVLAGGTWLVPDLGRGALAPGRVLDLAGAGLDGIAELSGGGLRVGAMCSYAQLLAEPAVAARAPLLALMAAQVTGGVTIRNQGTIGGSLIAARPQSDAPAAVIAAGAVAVVAGRAGERRLAVPALFADAMRTALGAGEILCALELPAPAHGHGYRKLKLGASSWPIATAAVAMAIDVEGRRGTGGRACLGGVAPTPVEIDLEPLLAEVASEPAPFARAAARAADAVTGWWGDELAPASYRAAVAAPTLRRALEDAFADAQATALG